MGGLKNNKADGEGKETFLKFFRAYRISCGVKFIRSGHT